MAGVQDLLDVHAAAMGQLTPTQTALLVHRVARLERALAKLAAFVEWRTMATVDHADLDAIRAEVKAIKAELPAAVGASDADTETPHRIESER